ncbi:MAG: SDR family NAD(P)-dependent oxidoreductase [Nevskiaceae bacterium]|nr:MAG: SDR family NAD(P)-dependent oxidoreductase [Nevskiaceae bacterium]TBR71661.1 MAG: SDR family NAD(P)-dependent oxidoreductase [Nevskiaceae bacterium]
MKSFAAKVAAITGAGSGIGRALANDLAGRKCHLALSDIDEVGLAETARTARAAGVQVTTQKVDVSKRSEVEAWAKQVVADHGKVNLIFNNAGVALGASIEGASYKDIEWLMSINFWGVVYGTKAFLPYLKANGEEGCVVNTSSVFGLVSVPSQSAYNAAKFAVRGFTECLREELAMQDTQVTALSVHPGGIKTNIARSARMDDSVSDLGLSNGSDSDSRAKFEKAFITTPEKAAKIILSAVQHGRGRVLVGPDAHVIDWMARLLPVHYQKFVIAFARRSMS